MYVIDTSRRRRRRKLWENTNIFSQSAGMNLLNRVKKARDDFNLVSPKANFTIASVLVSIIIETYRCEC